MKNILLASFRLCVNSDRLSQHNYDYSSVEVAGYGSESYTGPSSTRLKAATLKIITNQQCNDNYPYRITESQLCLLTPNKDTCTVSINQIE